MDEWNTDTNNYNFISLSQAIKKVSDIYNDTDTETSDLYNSNAIVNYEI